MLATKEQLKAKQQELEGIKDQLDGFPQAFEELRKEFEKKQLDFEKTQRALYEKQQEVKAIEQELDRKGRVGRALAIGGKVDGKDPLSVIRKQIVDQEELLRNNADADKRKPIKDRLTALRNAEDAFLKNAGGGIEPE